MTYALFASIVIGAFCVIVFVAAAFFLYWLYWPWLDRWDRPARHGDAKIMEIKDVRADRPLGSDFPTLADQQAVVVAHRLELRFLDDGETGYVTVDAPSGYAVGDRVTCRFVDGHSGKRWTWILPPGHEEFV